MPTAVTLIRSRSRSLSDVAEYAYAATVPADARLIFLAGACPLREDGSTIAPGDYAAQAAPCIANMSTALSEAGARLEDVISTRVLVASTKQADLVTAWNVVWELAWYVIWSRLRQVFVAWGRPRSAGRNTRAYASKPAGTTDRMLLNSRSSRGRNHASRSTSGTDAKESDIRPVSQHRS